MVELEYSFTITAPLEVEESFQDRAILKGTFLKLESATKNGNIYVVEEAQQIANGLIGMPVFFGTNPLDRNKHDKDLEHPEETSIGRVFKTIINEAKKTIEGWVEVWNNAKFPDLVQKIKKGWGFSIGGKASDKQYTGTVNPFGKLIVRVFGMKPNHLQLLSPETPRGQDDAKVEDIKDVEESLSFDPCPWGVCNIKVPTITIPEVQETVIQSTKRVIFVDDNDYIV
jgi:hypothetical protein